MRGRLRALGEPPPCRPQRSGHRRREHHRSDHRVAERTAARRQDPRLHQGAVPVSGGRPDALRELGARHRGDQERLPALLRQRSQQVEHPGLGLLEPRVDREGRGSVLVGPGPPEDVEEQRIPLRDPQQARLDGERPPAAVGVQEAAGRRRVEGLRATVPEALPAGEDATVAGGEEAGGTDLVHQPGHQGLEGLAGGDVEPLPVVDDDQEAGVAGRGGGVAHPLQTADQRGEQCERGRADHGVAPVRPHLHDLAAGGASGGRGGAQHVRPARADPALDHQEPLPRGRRRAQHPDHHVLGGARVRGRRGECTDRHRDS